MRLVDLKHQLPQLRDNPLNQNKLTQLEIPYVATHQAVPAIQSDTWSLPQFLAQHMPHCSAVILATDPDQRCSSATCLPHETFDWMDQRLS